MENKYKIFVIRANCYFNNVFANLFSLLLIFLASFQMSPAQSSQTAAFPLKYSANKKYLVDQNNVPFIIKEHSAWGAIQALTESAAADFMDSVKAKGFNTLMVSVLSNDQRFAGGPPKWNGNYPFTVLWDFSTPNPVYFNHVDNFINMANQRGMLLILVPCYFGNGSSEGFMGYAVDSHNSAEKCQTYGQFLGKRYKDNGNIIWCAGGDNSCYSDLEPLMQNIITGIKVNDSHLWTGHYTSPSWSTDRFTSYMDVDGRYNFDEGYLQYQAGLEYYGNGRPIFQIDQPYENDIPGGTNNSVQEIRRRNYDGLLSGYCGTSFSPGTSSNQCYTFQNWRPLMNTRGMNEAHYCFNLFDSRAWWDLIPDTNNESITAGRGTYGKTSYVCAARTSNGNSLITFIPTNRTITVNMAKISGTLAKAWWYNPVNGQSTLVGTYSTSGSKDFTPPTNADYALVIDDESLKLPPPGTFGTVSVTGITVNPASLAGLNIGSTYQLTATLAPSSATNKNVNWSSDSPGIASVDKNGIVTGVAIGTASIKATTEDGAKTATSTITVTNNIIAVTNVAISPLTTSVAIGSTSQLTVTITPSNATNKSITWKTSDTTIATVNINGLIMAKAAGTAIITVTTVDGGKTATSTIAVTSTSLPALWTVNDIGTPGLSGSATYNNGEFTVSGSGSDIWNTSDQFTFVSQDKTGDGNIIARITSQTNSDSWAKAGVMFRETINADSKYVMVVVTPANGLALQWRDAIGSSCNWVSLGSYTLPLYIKLERVGNTFNVSKSVDSISWGSSLRSHTNTFINSIKVGMCLTAHNNTSISTAKFNNVSVNANAVVPTITAKIYPRDGYSSRMQGGKFQGSNNDSSWTDLGSVTAAPPESGWTTYNLTSTTTWRYLRYLSPTGGYGNISELEFYNGSTKLVGTPIGTAGSWSNAGNTKEKALDGDVSTFFDAPTGDNNYVGIDTQGTTAARIAGEPGKLHTLSTLDVRIYPNPATNEVTIDSETPWIKLSILDINGKEKLSRTGYNRTEKIELNGMQPGVYVIKIQTREGIQIKKLIIY